MSDAQLSKPPRTAKVPSKSRIAYAQVLSRAGLGLSAPTVRIEVHLTGGLPGFTIVGLAAAAVRESRQRVRSAIENSGFDMPRRNIVVNLAPADLPKEGGRFDLAIAVGLLAAAGMLDEHTHAALCHYELLGELSLSGELRPLRGMLPAARACARAGRSLLLPQPSASEAALVGDLEAFGAQTLLASLNHLSGKSVLPRAHANAVTTVLQYPDLSDVQGQTFARRALEVAASGGHNMLMVGPPGTGKTLLAMRLPGIMPPLTDSESAEVAAVESISQAGFSLSRWRRRPFRAPHHSASAAAMVGGGRQARPGEISLAHHGVLFLDELPEFERRVLEVLREPLESGAMELSRVDYKVRLPASFQLVAAMNPCPCGYLGSPKCICSRTQIERYRTRISGPLLDRIDLHVAVNQQPTSVLQRQTSGEASAVVAARVAQTRDVQGSRGAINAHLGGESLARYCALKDQDAAFFVDAADNLGLSARSCHRVLRVARTIADMAAAAEIDRTHLLEALSYRAVSSV